MKNKKVNKDILEFFDNIPTTEELLKEIDKLDIPDWDKDPEFVADYLKGRITEDILTAMEEKGINKSQLAEKLGKSRQYVNRILNETANFTLDTLAKFACALDCEIEVKIMNKKKGELHVRKFKERIVRS